MSIKNNYNYKLKIIYKGQFFCGWQWNPGSITVQEVMEKAIGQVHNGMVIRIYGASRTDSGVHSYGQTANFYGPKLWDVNQLKKALNYYLDNTQILVDEVTLVDENFHSRYSAQGKIYTYQIYLDDFINPFDGDYYWVWNKNIDENQLKIGCEAIKNAKSLNGFAHWNQELTNDYTIQNLTYGINNKKLILTFRGKGFFYNEIRYLVGHIVYYASGMMDEENFLRPLNGVVDENYKKILAPAKGLFLMEVMYQN
jgi:tRNA pseudouridine38-40 synthase